MARPRKPAHLHALHGTHRPDRHGDLTAAAASEGLPEHPVPVMPLEARLQYAMLRTMLTAAGLANSADALLVAELARWLARADDAAATLAEDGLILEAGTNGAKYQHPALKIAATCSTHIARLSARLGLDPTTRQQWGMTAAATREEATTLPAACPPIFTPAPKPAAKRKAPAKKKTTPRKRSTS